MGLVPMRRAPFALLALPHVARVRQQHPRRGPLTSTGPNSRRWSKTRLINAVEGTVILGRCGGGRAIQAVMSRPKWT